MRLIRTETLHEWLASHHWREMPFGHIEPQFPATVFRGGFEPSAIVAADLSSLFLGELLEDQISSGLLYIYRMFPKEDAPVRFLHQLMACYSAPEHPSDNFLYEFSNEYDAVFMTMTWCLACEWEFRFITPERRFAISTNEDCEVTIYLGKDERLQATALKILQNNDFVELPG